MHHGIGLVTASTASEKAELLNHLFHSVFNTSLGNCSQESSSLPTSSLSSTDISYEDTFMPLTSLDPSKAMGGGDGIPPHILKHSATPLLYPIHHLFMLCLAQSHLPIEWRSHYITPIPKCGDRSPVSSYQTICLLCCLRKVLGSLVFDKESEFRMSSFVSLEQFGFVKNRSTLQHLVLYSEFLTSVHADRCQVNSYISIYTRLSILFHKTSFYPSCGMPVLQVISVHSSGLI